MLHKSSALSNRLLSGISDLPVIDCHEHMAGPEHMIRFTEPVMALTAGYIGPELVSAGAEPATLALLQNPDVPTEQKWLAFEAAWQRTCHTAYARVTRLVMEDVYGETDMSLAALRRIGEHLASRDEVFYWETLNNANICQLISDVLGLPEADFGRFLQGDLVFPDRWRILISLPMFHVVQVEDAITHDWAISNTCRDWFGVQRVAGWSDRDINSLDEFLEAVFEIFKLAKARGAVGIKDQSAYVRTLDYQVVPRYDAETIFNRLLADPRVVLGWPEAKPLDDFLFHAYMRFARELDLPVQLHTGHMAGIYNRVGKANARHLATVLELHNQVQFDLLHGNWPYMGDLLFLVKNYPNVMLDLTWLHIVDPLYAREMIKRAVVCLPHTKVFGFGGDYRDLPEYVAAHLKIARHVIASALTDLVESGWLDEDEAMDLAADWLFNNPNRFWGLGQQPVHGASMAHGT